MQGVVIVSYKEHKNKWKNCKLCPLHSKATKIVLGRGTVPSDILFIGEAPGQSEDVIGQPFVGPAGHLLDHIIEVASKDYLEDGNELSISFTNLIGCIPLDEENDKVSEPPKDSIKKCSGRLLEFIDLASPKLIVLVGKLAAKWSPTSDEWATIEIMHPAAILRLDQSQQGLAIQRTVFQIKDAICSNFIF